LGNIFTMVYFVTFMVILSAAYGRIIFSLLAQGWAPQSSIRHIRNRLLVLCTYLLVLHGSLCIVYGYLLWHCEVPIMGLASRFLVAFEGTFDSILLGGLFNCFECPCWNVCGRLRRVSARAARIQQVK